MKKFFKRLFLALALIMLLMVGAVAIIASLFEDRVGKRLAQEINKQLKTELSIDGFGLTVIRSFPNLSADLKGVRLEDTRGDALLQADRLSFRFGLFSLFGSEIKVKSMIISDAALRIHVDKKGIANYDIFQPSEEEETDGSMVIDLAEARLQRVALDYTDESSDQDLSVLVEEAQFSGAFSSEQFTLKSQAAMLCRYANLDGQRYLVGKPLSYDAEVSVDLKEGIYALQKVGVAIEGNAFKLDGRVESWDSGTYFDLYATAEDGNLAGLIALLPENYKAGLEGVESSGRFSLNALVKGQYNEKQSPDVRVEFSLDEGQLMSDKLAKPLKEVSFNAVFSNGKYRDNRSSSFTLERFKAYFNRELIEMRLRVANFDEPEVDFFLNGAMPMAMAYGLLGNPKITGGSGEVEIDKLEIKGAYADLISPSRIGRVQASGAVVFDDAAVMIGEETLMLDRGELRIDGNRLYVNDVRLEGAGSDVVFRGSAFNLLPVLFADSVNSQGVQLEFTAALIAESIDFDRLAQFTSLTPEEEEAPEPVRDSLIEGNLQNRERIVSLLNGTFISEIKGFDYGQIQGRNFDGKLGFNNGRIDVRGKLDVFGGKVDLDGEAFFEGAPRLEAKMTCDGVDVSVFLAQTENLGQEVITHHNLHGTLNAKMAIYAYWDEQGQFLMDKLRVLAGIGISNGELRELKMMEDFSTFVNIRDLQRIKFVDMQNFLEIRNGRLYLPAMFIRSNALNLTVNGEHSFENEIRYNIKVNAGQVMADRFRRHDPSLSPRPTKRGGWFNLYYSILGTLDDYNIVSAKRRVKSDFELSEVRKRDIRLALERAFGSVELIEEPTEWEDQPSASGGGQEEFLDFEIGGR